MVRDGEAAALYEAGARFKEVALRTDGSLFTPGKAIWTQATLDELHRRYSEGAALSPGSFLHKLRQQLYEADPRTVQLAAELFFVYLLMPLDTSGATKRRMVTTVLSWMPEGSTVALPTDLGRALDAGIARLGAARASQDAHVAFLLAFARYWKGLEAAERGQLLADPWAFKASLFSERLPHYHAGVPREGLLHLLFPHTFEPIASSRHKHMIAERFAGAMTDSATGGDEREGDADDVDRRLLRLRPVLEAQYGSGFDYYADPVRAAWQRRGQETGDEREDDPEVGIGGDEGGETVEDGDAFGAMLRALQNAGLCYSVEVVATYLLALQTKRFVILSGISGTGKTRLARAVAHHLSIAAGAAPEECCLVTAVRPDWTDNRGLLGYFNPLTNQYATTQFLRLLLRADAEWRRAREEARAPRSFFAILDEMNLARVEHYFSDFLSAMESGERLHLHDDVAVEQGAVPGAVAVPRELAVPPNLYFTGTVNVDETTYMFSPKVLDRAFVIELSHVDLTAFGLDDAAPDETAPLYLHAFSGRLDGRAPRTEDWTAFGRLLDGAPRQTVMALHEILARDQRHYGYRVAVEMARFVLLAARQAGEAPETLWAALDLAILQKVLPKLHGTQQELEGVLHAVQGFAGMGRAGEAADGIERRSLPRTAEKVERMAARLRQQGFTSFIV